MPLSTKTDLLQGVTEHVIQEFRTSVQTLADAEHETESGRLTRAYIRVSFAHANEAEELRNGIRLAANLMVEPDVQHLVDEDAAYWRRVLMQDGLKPSVVRLIVTSADGSNTGPSGVRCSRVRIAQPSKTISSH